MDRRSLLQMTAMLAAAHGLPGTAFGAAEHSPYIDKVPHPQTG